jgi:hypothetical protein
MTVDSLVVSKCQRRMLDPNRLYRSDDVNNRRPVAPGSAAGLGVPGSLVNTMLSLSVGRSVISHSTRNHTHTIHNCIIMQDLCTVLPCRASATTTKTTITMVTMTMTKTARIPD